MKRSLRKIQCFFLLLLTLPLLMLTAWAEEPSAKLNSLHFDIALQEDGSALITETREILFGGDREFTRYGVNNFFTGPRVFGDWQVYIDGTPLSQLDVPDNENRPENTFAVEDKNEGNTVYIYFRQQGSGSRIFQISYRVENAVKLYSDVGEFFWNLTAENGISDIGTLTATLTVPENIPSEEFLIWAHGPLNGSFEKQPDGSAALYVENVSLGTIVDIRSAMPAEYFYGGWEQEGEALDDILSEEKQLADSANAKREEEERYRAEREAYWAERDAWEENHPVLSYVQNFCLSVRDSVQFFLEEHGVLALVIFIFAFPLLLVTGLFRIITHFINKSKLKKFRKQPAQTPEYYEHLPDDRPAPVVDRLIHFYDGKSDISRQLSAAMLELNFKRLIRFRTASGDTEILLDEKLGADMFPNAEHSTTYLEALWNFLRNAANENGCISIKNLQKHIKDNRESALKLRNNFRDAVESEYAKSVLSEKVEGNSSKRIKPRLIFAAAAGILAMVICMFSTLYDGAQVGFSILAGLAVFVAAFIIPSVIMFWISFMQQLEPCFILDQQSEDDLALWQAFGRFLNEFASLSDKELPDLSVWEEYMVYAVAMGYGKKVASELALKYPEARTEWSESYDDDMYYWMQNMALYDAMDNIGRDVAEVTVPVSSSDYSDSDGGGGGFSDFGGGSDSGSGGDFID